MDPHATAREHRRIAILRHLDALPQYGANASILLDVVRGVGVATTADQMRGELSWLEEQDLVRLQHNDTFTLAEITSRGSEVAQGNVIAPGVKRPSAR